MATQGDSLFTFFAVVYAPQPGPFSLRRVKVDADVQQELSAKFGEMAKELESSRLQRKAYAPTFHPNDYQVIVVPDFSIPEIYVKAASSTSSYPPLKFPPGKDEQLLAVVAVDAKRSTSESRVCVQTCYQRHML